MKKTRGSEEKFSQNQTRENKRDVCVNQKREVLEALRQTWFIELKAGIRPRLEASDALREVRS